MTAFRQGVKVLWRAVGGPWLIVPILIGGVLAWPNRLLDPAATIPCAMSCQ